MPPTTPVTGARAKVYIADPNTGKAELIGIFNSVSLGLTYDVQPVYILGRFGPAASVYTGQEPVSVQCGGFRVVGAGVHLMARMPNVKDLLTHEYIQIVVHDRQSGKKLHVVNECRPVSYSTTISARDIEQINITYIGLRVDDESTALAESADASTLPVVP